MPAPEPTNAHEEYSVFHIKREPLYIWLARFTWLIGLIVLAEYAIQSHREREPQAAITAGALLLVLLFAGIIVEVVRYVESQPESRLLRDMARANANHRRNETNNDSASSAPTITHMRDKDASYD